MKAGLVGPSYVMRSLPFDAQRCINLFPVVSEAQSKEPGALYGTPGLKLFATAGNGPIRGGIMCGNGRMFVLSGNGFYEIGRTGTATLWGTVSTFNGAVSISENGLQVFIATGAQGYTFTFATNTLALVTDGDFPGADYVTFIDGYFVVSRPNSGEFYVSNIYDGTSWVALEFATAESSPDKLVAPFSAYGQLWLFGENSVEIWYTSQNVDFPFERSSGSMEVGCAARFSIVKADNSIFWLGKDANGKGIVYRAAGASPQRISTHAIEYAIAKSGDLGDVVGYCYQQEGHLFYVLTGGNLETSLVYDASTGLWHERAFLSNGDLQQHRGLFHWAAFGKSLTGDRIDGRIYELDLDTYTDNGDEIHRSRTFSHISDEGRRIVINYLEVHFEAGVGLTTGQGSDPKVWLEVSQDGGKTWSSAFEATIGKIGEYQRVAVWRRLGQSEQWTFRVSISDPVKVAITGAYFG